MKTFGPVYAGKAPHAVCAFGALAGNDLIASVSGGTAPHIGAAVLAEPGNSFVHTAGLLCLPGHRDDLPAHALAKKLCRILGRTVCLTAGLHIDDASPKDIEMLLHNAEEAVQLLADAILTNSHPFEGQS